MGFFNDIGKKTSEATSKITKETKLKLKMGDNKSKINSLYQEIGKKIYEKHVRENGTVDEDLKEEIEKIDTLSKEIEEARLEVLKLNNKRLCPNCLAEIEKTAAFCSKCGEKLEAEVEVTEVPENVKEAEEAAKEAKEDNEESEE